MEATSYAIELTFNGQTKLVRLASASEDYWNSLEKQFRELFPIGNETVSAKHFDEEGDLIVLDSNEELQELLSQGKPLKIELFVASNKKATSHEERLRHREEKMLRKYGKLLTKEEKRQLRKERMDERKAKKERKFGEKMQKKSGKRAAEEMVHSNDGAKPEEPRSRRLTPEERKEMIEQRKKQRLEERQARNEAGADDDVTEWPDDANQLYLDGNNMMFVTAKLRNLTLGRNRRQAEALLAVVAKSFILSQSGKIESATLIFDNTSTDERMILGKDTMFRICSARPQQPTSDDVLIAWAKEGKEEGRSNGMVFVTSDRALREQLKEAGGRLMKPKHWLRLARNLALSAPSTDTDLSDGELDDWLSSLHN